MAISLQRPLFLADIPYFDSHLNLSTMAFFFYPKGGCSGEVWLWKVWTQEVSLFSCLIRFNCVNTFSTLSKLLFLSNKTKNTPVSFFESLKCKNEQLSVMLVWKGGEGDGWESSALQPVNCCGVDCNCFLRWDVWTILSNKTIWS